MFSPLIFWFLFWLFLMNQQWSEFLPQHPFFHLTLTFALQALRTEDRTHCRWRSSRLSRWGEPGSGPTSWSIHRCLRTAAEPGWGGAPPRWRCAYLQEERERQSPDCAQTADYDARDSLSKRSSVSENLEKSALNESTESAWICPPGSSTNPVPACATQTSTQKFAHLPSLMRHSPECEVRSSKSVAFTGFVSMMYQ